MRLRDRLCAFAIAAMSACGGNDAVTPDAGDAVVFPPDYDTRFEEVRSCRQGTQHGPDIRIFASASAVEPYQNRTEPFPVGAVLVKEEHFGGGDCTGPLTQWTAMIKREEGSSPTTLDWTWQQVDPDRTLVGEDLARCHECHVDCPGGYAGTCTPP